MHIMGSSIHRRDKKGLRTILSGLLVSQKYVFWQYVHAQCECFAGYGCIRREMPRAFIWYVYYKGLLHLAGQERVLGNSFG